MDYMFWVWLAVIIVTAVIEFATMDIASIWFTIGAIVPFILAGTKAVGWHWQLVIFIVTSAVLIIALRPATKKWLLKSDNTKTNAESLVGKHFRLKEKTDFETIGSVKVNGVVWSAVSVDNELIEANEIVEVVKIDGNKLLVKKVEKK